MKLFGSKHSVKNCSKTLIVDLTLMSGPGKKMRCYAILDEQSSSTFVDPIVAEFFGINTTPVSYTLNTLTGSSTSTQGIIIEGVKVKGVNEKKTHFLAKGHYQRFYTEQKVRNSDSRYCARSPPHEQLCSQIQRLKPMQTPKFFLMGRDAG